MGINRIFISHTESDSDWVERQLIPALVDAGMECHHEDLFQVGKPRLQEFSDAVGGSDWVVLILSPAYLVDDSQEFVKQLAQHEAVQSQKWNVIPVIREDSMLLPSELEFLESIHATDQVDMEDVAEKLCRRFEVDPPSKPEKPNCPYPGMNPFEEDGDYPFYGRRTEVREILERLRLHPFLAVIGASGSGKSSLVHAGLLPELESSTLFGDGSWLFSSFRPSQRQKDQSLVSQLSSHLGGNLDDLDSAAATVTSLLQSVSDNGQADAARLLLVIDQFEEVYTLQNERDEELQLTRQDADEFQETLLRLAEVAQCYVVLTVRADFFGELIESPIWEKGVKNHRYELTTLGAQGMRQAIVQPALDQKVCIDQALVERLLAETGSEPGILPFLQETLVLLWEKLQWRYLSVLDYESLVKGRIHEFGSGLEVAMAQRADAAINALPSANHHQVARRILLRLVQFGEGRSHTRRQQTVAQLSSTHSDPETFKTTLQHLTEKRLLTIGDPRAGQDASLAGKEQDERPNKFQDDHRVLDVAHDKLITGWPALGKWIHERQNAEETRRWLESKTKEWIALGRRRFGGALLDKVELAQCDKWLGTADAHDLGEIPEIDQLVRRSRRWLLLQRGLIAAIPLLVIAAMGVWIWGVYGIAAKETERANTALRLEQEATKRAEAEEREKKVAQQLVTEEKKRAEDAESHAKQQSDLRKKETTARQQAEIRLLERDIAVTQLKHKWYQSLTVLTLYTSDLLLSDEIEAASPDDDIVGVLLQLAERPEDLDAVYPPLIEASSEFVGFAASVYKEDYQEAEDRLKRLRTKITESSNWDDFTPFKTSQASSSYVHLLEAVALILWVDSLSERGKSDETLSAAAHCFNVLKSIEASENSLGIDFPSILRKLRQRLLVEIAFVASKSDPRQIAEIAQLFNTVSNDTSLRDQLIGRGVLLMALTTTCDGLTSPLLITEAKWWLLNQEQIYLTVDQTNFATDLCITYAGAVLTLNGSAPDGRAMIELGIQHLGARKLNAIDKSLYWKEFLMVSHVYLSGTELISRQYFLGDDLSSRIGDMRRKFLNHPSCSEFGVAFCQSLNELSSSIDRMQKDIAQFEDSAQERIREEFKKGHMKCLVKAAEDVATNKIPYQQVAAIRFWCAAIRLKTDGKVLDSTPEEQDAFARKSSISAKRTISKLRNEGNISKSLTEDLEELLDSSSFVSDDSVDPQSKIPR